MAAGSDAFEGGGIPIELGRPSFGDGIAVALKAAMFEKQFATETALRGGFRGRGWAVGESGSRNGAGERGFFRPFESDASIALPGADERGYEPVGTFVELHRFGERREVVGAFHFSHGDPIDLKGKMAAEVRLEEKRAAQIRMQGAFPNGGELAGGQEWSRALAGLHEQGHARDDDSILAAGAGGEGNEQAWVRAGCGAQRPDEQKQDRAG